MATVFDINKVQYSELDVNTHSDNILARIQAKWGNEYNDFAISSLGIMLVDIVANALGSLSFYLDRRASDLFLETSRTPKSITKLSRQKGYKLAAAASSSTDLTVSLTRQYDFPIPIPQGFQFSGPNGLIFEAAQEVVIPKLYTGSVTVPVYEGESSSDSFVSDGTANQVFRLRAVPEGKFIVAGTVGLTVDGSPFEEVLFIEPGATDTFEISYAEAPPTLKFGDGLLGNIPINTGRISVTYISAKGLQGQVAANTIVATVGDLTVNLTRIPLTITNPFPSSGGADPESFTSAKAKASQVYKSRQQAITKADYEALAGAFADPVFGKVAVAQAVPTRSASGDTEIQNQLSIIGTAVGFKPALDGYVASAQDSMASMDTYLDNLNASLLEIAALVSSLSTTDLTNAQTLTRSAQKTQMDLLPLVTGASSGIVDIANAAIGAVNAFTTAPSTTAITQTDKDAINSSFNRLASQATIISNTANTVLSKLSQILAIFSGAIDKTEQIGFDFSAPPSGETSSKLYDADQSRIAIQENGSTALADLVLVDLSNISALSIDVTTTVSEATTVIATHVDRVLSSDSKANLITVPILTKDAAGFYASPSSGLLRTLQNYLDARKEVTQTVEVVSGDRALVAAALTIRLGVSKGFSESVLSKTVNTLIDGVLRDRKFGASLFTSDLVSVIKGVNGISFVNVKIDGNLQNPADTSSAVLGTRLDIDDNLIIASGEVVTKGVTTINTEPVV